MDTITYASDCSGIGAPEVALNGLGIHYRYVFASEIDKHARLMLENSENPPEHIYSDVTQRSPTEGASVDLYTAGFPCVAFSGCGHMLAFNDPRGRIFFSIYEYLNLKQPTAFVLENVKMLLTINSGRTWQTILDHLQGICDEITGEPAYNVEWRVISPHELGYPQSRQRLFIVGRHRRKLGNDAVMPFPFPQPTHPPAVDALNNILLQDADAKRMEPQCCRPLTTCAQEKVTLIKAKLAARGITWSHDTPYIVDPHTSIARIRLGMSGASLCLTTRCNEFYVLARNRYITSIEALKIQGFHQGDLDQQTLMQTPASQRFKMAGNSMHVDVVAAILMPLVRMLHRSKASP